MKKTFKEMQNKQVNNKNNTKKQFKRSHKKLITIKLSKAHQQRKKNQLQKILQ